MIGSILVQCACDVCDSSLPSLDPSYTTLFKGITATTSLNFSLPGDEPQKNTEVFTSSDLECNNQNSYEHTVTGPLTVYDYSNWPISIPDQTLDILKRGILSLNVDSEVKIDVTWQRGSETVETTTGGFSRVGQNTLLVSSGVEIERKIYEFNMVNKEAFYIPPDFTYETYDMPWDCCCSESETPCPEKTYVRVEPGDVDSRIPEYDSSLDTLYLKYPGKIKKTYSPLRIVLANNAANNNRYWTFRVSSGRIFISSSDGISLGPYSGGLTGVRNSIALQTSYFSSVTLDSNLISTGGLVVAATGDLPNWSTQLKRGEPNDYVDIPMRFPGSEAAPSTYDCGFFTSIDSDFFATNYSDVVGTFGYTETANAYVTFLLQTRYAQHPGASFVANGEDRGLYYIDEFDSWLDSSSDTTEWEGASIVGSTRTQNYDVPGYTYSKNIWNLTQRTCCQNTDPTCWNQPEQCDTGLYGGNSPNCPSNEYWQNNLDIPLPESILAERGLPWWGTITNYGTERCDGTLSFICQPDCPEFGPCIGLAASTCICGEGNGPATAYFSFADSTATQTITGQWYLSTG